MKNAVVRFASPDSPCGTPRRVGAVLMAGIVSASAQALPDIENGRYSLSPIAEGVIRLDTRTGTVSTCTDKGSGWACYVCRMNMPRSIPRSGGCRRTTTS